MQHGQRDAGGAAGIDGIAARLENRETGGGGEIVAGGDGVTAAVERRAGGFHDDGAPQIGLPALVAQRVISSLLGSVLSATLRAVSTPATGRPWGSSRPTCTSTEAWSQ